MHRPVRALALAAFLAVPAALPAAAAPCALTEAKLLGGWVERGDGGGPFQVMEFAVEDGQPVFRSWLHQRPEIAQARWSLKGCRLRIDAMDSVGLEWDLAAGMTAAGRLVLRERGAPAAQYRRAPP